MRQGRAAAVLAAPLLLGLAAGALAADTATLRAFSGQPYEGFIADPGDTHAYILEDFAPQPVTIVLKASKGSALLPDLTLEDPAAADVTADLLPFRTDGARSVKVTKATNFTQTGRYVLRVAGKSGSTGGYTLKATAKVTKTFKGTGLVATAGGTDEFSFFAPTEAAVSLKATPAAGSTIAPRFVLVFGSACADVRLLPGTTQGTATFTSGFSFLHTARVTGDGGTGGPFNWKAKVKPAKPSKKAIRANGGAPAFPGPGPAPALFTANPGQDVSGFDADGTMLCWREVRTQGGGPNLGRNSVGCATLAGKGLPGIANNFATDAAPPPRTFALGPTHAAAVAAGALHALPRLGGMALVLDASLNPVTRLLVDDGAVYVMESGGVFAYPFAGGGPLPRSTGTGTLRDMAFGATGIAYALVTGGGDLEVRTVDRAGGSDVPLGSLGPDPGFQALAARGADVFVAVSDGASGSLVYAFSACFPGSGRQIAISPNSPVRAMCTDEANVYLTVEDPAEGIRVAQLSRGGGEATVLARGGPGFSWLGGEIVASKGYAYLLADDGGSPNFYRVKRR